MLKLLALGVLCAACACRTARPVPTVAAARAFREDLARGELASARARTSADPRRWFEERSGEGAPWNPGGTGPWSGWDEHFRSSNEVLGWSGDARTATLRVLESNDYYRLLERPPGEVHVTYHFDDEGRIEGQVIAGVGERHPGRSDEFVAWAEVHAPEELAELRPGGRIDPTGDHPQRFRALLERWRRAAGLPPLE